MITTAQPFLNAGGTLPKSIIAHDCLGVLEQSRVNVYRFKTVSDELSHSMKMKLSVSSAASEFRNFSDP